MDRKSAQIGWCAGIIDGEGTFSIYRTKQKSGGYGYSICVHVRMTHKETIYKLREILETGDVSGPRYNGPKCKDVYRWAVTKYSAVNLVKEILPFLITKNEQARVFLQFSQNWTRLVNRHTERTEEETLILEALWLEMRELNRKGKLLPVEEG